MKNMTEITRTVIDDSITSPDKDNVMWKTNYQTPPNPSTSNRYDEDDNNKDDYDNNDHNVDNDDNDYNDCDYNTACVGNNVENNNINIASKIN